MVKEKETRIYDEDGFRRRAAAICVKDDLENEVCLFMFEHDVLTVYFDGKQILLVSSSRTPDKWIVPGGGLEPNEDSFEAAAREVMEEAGVRGVLSRALGQFENLERKHRTSVYVLIVTEELDEWDDSKNIGRKRKWFNIDEALDLLVCQPFN